MFNQLTRIPDILLMGPGPSCVSDSVYDALAKHTLGHMDPTFIALMDEIKEYLNSINSKFDFSIKIIKWDVGNERYIGEGHGRRIYSDYGGLETQFMPFEMYKKDGESDNFYHKDTSFFFINEESYLNWNKIGKELSKNN